MRAQHTTHTASDRACRIKFDAKGTSGVGPFLEATKTALEWSQAKNADGTGTEVAAADAGTKRYKGILINGGVGDVLRCEVTSLAYIFQDLLFLMEVGSFASRCLIFQHSLADPAPCTLSFPGCGTKVCVDALKP